MGNIQSVLGSRFKRYGPTRSEHRGGWSLGSDALVGSSCLWMWRFSPGVPLDSLPHSQPLPGPSSCVQPLKWVVGNSPWHLAELPDRGGGGGEAALNLVLVRMLWVAETKP